MIILFGCKLKLFTSNLVKCQAKNAIYTNKILSGTCNSGILKSVIPGK